MADAIFTATVVNNRGIVSRNNLEGKPPFRLEFAPAEGEKATYLIGVVLSLGRMYAYPEFIENAPFVVRFFNNPPGFALERADTKGSMPFRFEEADELIRVIRQAVDMGIDSQRLQGPARPASGNPMGYIADEVMS